MYSAGDMAILLASSKKCAPPGTRYTATFRIGAVNQHALPNEWQDAIRHLCLIIRIARKLVPQESFLVEQPPDQHRKFDENDEEPPPRAERERHGDEHDECPSIHRMAHERIGTRGNDGLAFGDLNRRGAVAVFPEHEEDE